MWGGRGSQSFLSAVAGIALICVALSNSQWPLFGSQPSLSFVQRNGTHFVVDGMPFYINGWNSYWLMAQSIDSSSRSSVRTILRKGAEMGLSVCRTWAFYDGGNDGLQPQQGKYNEQVFRALDYVIVEARKHKVRLLLSLVNNLPAFGGKGQYVEWARGAGAAVGTSNDSFFIDPIIRDFYKSYVKSILNRVNSINGVVYRDDPTIFAWELINEPRCASDPSGDTLQAWLEDMASYIKSIDCKHLLTVGLEGFYGQSTPEKFKENPGEWAKNLGSDFIRHSKIDLIDFASVHAYPDSWVPRLNMSGKLRYFEKWVASHVQDGSERLNKPVLFTEFGLSDLSYGFQVKHREVLLKTMYDKISVSANKKGAGAGALVWQYTVEGIDRFSDEYAIIPWQQPSIYKLILEQSCRLQSIIEGSLNKTASLSACSKPINF
eukprot:c18687_g1_i1 orf=613-1914(+)